MARLEQRPQTPGVFNGHYCAEPTVRQHRVARVADDDELLTLACGQRRALGAPPQRQDLVAVRL